jgi:hypothetical protein
MVRPGLFLSNAAGLPLERPAAGSGLPGEGFFLLVEKSDQGTEELLFLDGLQIASRTISGEGTPTKIEEKRNGLSVYRAELDRNGLQSEWWPEEERVYDYDGIHPVRIDKRTYHYGKNGNLAAARGEGEYFLALRDNIVYEEFPLHASLFSRDDASGEQAYRLWERNELSRMELREELEGGRFRETVLTADGGEEIRIFDDQSRLREIRGRNESSYYLLLYEYTGNELTSVSWRSSGEREESRFLYRDDKLDLVSSYRNGSLIQRITVDDDGYLVFRYRGGEELFREKIPFSDLHHFLEQFHTLEPSSF